MNELGLTLPEFDRKLDPSNEERDSLVEWTIPDEELKRMRMLYEQKCCKSKKKSKISHIKNDEEQDDSEKEPILKKPKYDDAVSCNEENSSLAKESSPELDEVPLKKEKDESTEENSLPVNTFNDNVVKSEIISF